MASSTLQPGPGESEILHARNPFPDLADGLTMIVGPNQATIFLGTDQELANNARRIQVQ